VFREAWNQLSILDILVMVTVATWSTIGMYKNHPLVGQPIYYHVIPVFWIAMFLLTWIVIAVFRIRR